MLCAKDYTATFFLKSSITHPSFIVNGNNVKDGEKYTISDSEKIYTDFDDGDFFEVSSILIRCYYDDEYNPNQTIIRPIIKGDDYLPYFTIGNISGAQNISIEGVPKYKTIDLNLKTIVDGYIKETGRWYINGKESKPPHSISAAEDFFVSYEFDNSTFYLLSAEPEKRILTDSENSVVFMLDKSSNINRNVDYSVTLKPYSKINVTKDKHIHDILVNDISVLGNLSEIKFKSNDEIVVLSDRNYRVDESNGLEIVDTLFEDNYRKTTLRIPHESTIYEYKISVIEQEEATLFFRLVYEGIESKNIGSLLKELNFSIKNGDNEIIDYNDLIEKEYLEVEVKDDSFLSLYLYTPLRNLKISYRIKSDSADKQETNEAVQGRINRSFSYNEIRDINEVEITISRGITFTPESINNDDNIGIVSYYYNRKPIQNQCFIPVGSIITIEIAEVPENRKLMNQGQVLDRTENTIIKDIIVEEKTNMSMFEIKANDIPSFYINPNDYSFENGHVEIQIKKGDGEFKAIKGDTLLLENDTVRLVDIDHEDGYVLQPYKTSEKSDFYSKDDFNTWINNSKFVIEEETYTFIGKLPQPDFWYVTYRYDSEDGNIVKEGDLEKKNRTIVCLYNAPTGFSCPNKDGTRIEELTVDELASFKPKAYEELDDNKPNLIVTLEDSNSFNDEFSLVIKYKNQDIIETLYKKNRNAFEGIAYYFNWQNDFSGKISTTSPLVLEFRNFKNFGKALEISVMVKFKDKGKSEELLTSKYRTSSTYTLDIFSDFISDENGCPISEINVKIKMIDAILYEPPTLENATIKVFLADKEIERNYPINEKDLVHVKIIPDKGYYIEDTKSEDYSYEFDRQFSQIENEIAKHQAVKLVNVYLNDYRDKGLIYKSENQEISPGWHSFKLGDKLYFEIETGKDNFNVINWSDFWGNNWRYSHSISAEDTDKHLTLEDFNCMEKESK